MSEQDQSCSTIIVMGVTGSGKTTVGAALAGELGWDFVDGDSFHSRESRVKIAAAVPLTDQDREPWLTRLGTVMASPRRSVPGLVLACSALKKRYRDVLRKADPGAEFVYLRGTAELISKRLQARTGHFAPPALLTSQFVALEEPDSALTVEIDADMETIVRTIRSEFGL